MKACYDHIAESFRTGETVRTREFSVMTVAGKVDVRYPYTPGGNGFDPIRRLLGAGTYGDAKATASVRGLAAETGCLLGSFAEAASYLGRSTAVRFAAETVRKITLKAGEKTGDGWKAGAVGKTRTPVRRGRIPEDAVRVGPTVVVSLDGTGVPCVGADVAGRKGRETPLARTREVKVITVARYEYADRNGRPVLTPANTLYRVTADPAGKFDDMLLEMARRVGYDGTARCQFITDGAEWAKSIHGMAFHESIRTVDFYHVCGYLHKVLEAMVPAKRLKQRYALYKRKLMNKSGKELCESLEANYGARLKNLPEEAAKAYRYIQRRTDFMNYGWLRKNGYYIGSGAVESACRFLVAARCKQAGMHWRHRNAAKVALLRATLRSNRNIIA